MVIYREKVVKYLLCVYGILGVCKSAGSNMLQKAFYVNCGARQFPVYPPLNGVFRGRVPCKLGQGWFGMGMGDLTAIQELKGPCTAIC